MKKELLEKITSLLTKIIINEEDNEHLVNQKKLLQSQILFDIFSNLIVSERIQNIIFSNFEEITEIYADVISATHNPNCSCRQKVFSFFGENFNLCKNIFLKILSNDEVSYEELESIYEMVESNIETINNIYLDIIGKVFEINDNDKDYYDFIKKINHFGGFYRGIYISKHDNKLKLYIY